MESVSMSAEEKTGTIVARVLIAICEATSPPACPPIPSATAKSEELVIAESSLPLRAKPIALRAETAK
jgi:hypothetical protein